MKNKKQWENFPKSLGSLSIDLANIMFPREQANIPKVNRENMINIVVKLLQHFVFQSERIGEVRKCRP